MGQTQEGRGGREGGQRGGEGGQRGETGGGGERGDDRRGEGGERAGRMDTDDLPVVETTREREKLRGREREELNEESKRYSEK